MNQTRERYKVQVIIDADPNDVWRDTGWVGHEPYCYDTIKKRGDNSCSYRIVDDNGGVVWCSWKHSFF